MSNEIDQRQIREIIKYLRGMSNGADAMMIQNLLRKHQQLIEVVEASTVAIEEIKCGIPFSDRHYHVLADKQLRLIKGALSQLK